jgi:hypothetical protein
MRPEARTAGTTNRELKPFTQLPTAVVLSNSQGALIVTAGPPSGFERLLADYRIWLVVDRGLADATVHRYEKDQVSERHDHAVSPNPVFERYRPTQRLPDPDSSRCPVIGFLRVAAHLSLVTPIGHAVITTIPADY